LKRAEIVKLLKFLNSYYQNKFEYPKDDKKDSKFLENTWLMFLEEYEYDLVSTNLKKLVVNKPKWPPTPGELVQEIQKALLPEEDEISGPEAWGMLVSAIRRYSALYHPDKVLENVPERVAKTAQVVGLNAIARSNEAETFMMNRFIKTYEQFKQVDMERKMLPGSIRKDYEKIKGRSETEKLANKFKGNPAIEREVRENA
jgi:hypothetical protein